MLHLGTANLNLRLNYELGSGVCLRALVGTDARTHLIKTIPGICRRESVTVGVQLQDGSKNVE